MGGPGTHGESDCDGCPGGWVRSAFALSFMRYRKGPHLAACKDRLVHDAVDYYEGEQARHGEAL